MRSVRLPPRRQRLPSARELASTVGARNSHIAAPATSSTRTCSYLSRERLRNRTTGKKCGTKFAGDRHAEHTCAESDRCNAHRQRQDHHQFCERCAEDHEILGKAGRDREMDRADTEIR